MIDEARKQAPFENGGKLVEEDEKKSQNNISKYNHNIAWEGE